jgi:hypothetical protein
MPATADETTINGAAASGSGTDPAETSEAQAEQDGTKVLQQAQAMDNLSIPVTGGQGRRIKPTYPTTQEVDDAIAAEEVVESPRAFATKDRALLTRIPRQDQGRSRWASQVLQPTRNHATAAEGAHPSPAPSPNNVGNAAPPIRVQAQSGEAPKHLELAIRQPPGWQLLTMADLPDGLRTRIGSYLQKWWKKCLWQQHSTWQDSQALLQHCNMQWRHIGSG